MKLITTILLTMFLLGCKAQEKQTLIYYDTVTVQALQKSYDSLLLINEILTDAIEISSTSVIADTFNFELIGNGINCDITKRGENVWYNLIVGPKRINADYIDGEIRIMLMDSLSTIGSSFIP